MKTITRKKKDGKYITTIKYISNGYVHVEKLS